MVFMEKTQPAPASLAIEKQKLSGTYRKQDVIDQLEADCFNKCYVCEQKEITSINVEHIVPHQGNRDLEFDWNNLCLSCAHCNNTKLARHDKILNCTVESDSVETALKYLLNSFPEVEVNIEVRQPSQKCENTKDFLDDVFNGKTPIKKLETKNIRSRLNKEFSRFIDEINTYLLEPNPNDESQRRIRESLSRQAEFAAFKRWHIRSNQNLNRMFSQFFD